MNQPDLRYKVIYNLHGNFLSAIDHAGRVLYSTKTYTIAPIDLSKKSYFLTVFETEKDAEAFYDYFAIDPNHLETWLVACKGKLKELLPERGVVELSPNRGLLIFHGGWYNLWPKGTEMYRRVRLVKRLYPK